MLSSGKAVKVSIYLSEGATHHGASTYSSILDFLFFRGIAGATVLKGVAGFGANHHIHSANFVEIADKLPVKIEFIETPEKIEQLLPKLQELVGSGLIESHETTVIKAEDASAPERPPSAGTIRIQGKARLMQIYFGESDRWDDKPLYEALVQALRANDIAGVTVFRGILGYGAHRRVHKDSPLHLSHDSSIMLSIVDTEEKLQSFLPLADKMVQEGIIVMSDVDIIKYSHRPTEIVKGDDRP
jgi:PII-like signaling protein